MKDNNKNLSNELNDGEMEAVAGGKLSGWSTKKIKNKYVKLGFLVYRRLMPSYQALTKFPSSDQQCK